MVAPRYWTAEMVRALPDDGKRYEVVYGELLVSPSPRPLHQLVLQRLLLAVGNYLEHERVGVVFTSPADISWGDDILVQPDLFVVERAQAATLRWASMQSLLLACEVLSPSSVRADRFTKRVAYQRNAVGTYWVVDADEGTVEVWRPGATFPETADAVLTWQPAGAATALTMPLTELFAPI
ncbi:MAG: Uma2 family endonuclease [Gemmatimonadetes bacterium]|nr:Uma2 family endonuclease [Gemmatimonadota bacterium]